MALSNLFWITMIPINCLALYRWTIVNMFRNKKLLFHFLCFGIPLIFAIVLIIINTVLNGDVLVDVQVWCWISGDYQLMRFFFYYLWLFCASFLFIGLFCWILIDVKGYGLSRFLIVKFGLYMATLLITNLFSIINRIHTIFFSPSEILNALQVSTTSLQGILMALVFYFIRKIDRIQVSTVPLLPKDYNDEVQIEK